jgi:hypothetical protein
LEIRKVDPAGNLLPGAVIDGELCQRSPPNLSYQCESLTGYPWFTIGFTLDGSTEDSCIETFVTRAGLADTGGATFPLLAGAALTMAGLGRVLPSRRAPRRH